MSTETAIDQELSGREGPPLIDARLPKFNQGVLTAVLAVSFALNFWYPVPIMALVLGLGTAFGANANPVMLAFVKILKPRLGPPKELEDPRPPRFAALLGTIFLAAATVCFVAGLSLAGWILTLIVAVLAFIAAAFNFCVGCELYVIVRRQFGSFSGPWRTPGPASSHASGTDS